MSWLIVCGLITLSAIPLLLLLNYARLRLLRPKAQAPLERARPISPGLWDVTVVLEVQFLVAPLKAIREAEERLALERPGAARIPPPVDESISPERLRSTFERLLAEVEASAKVRR